MVDSVTITQDQDPESQEHIDKMTAKADGETQTPDNPETPEDKGEDRPEWLPEKFKNAEDLAKSYAELEKKLSKGDAPAEAEEAPKDEDNTQEDAREAADKAGLDFDALNVEYNSNGGLSDETYKSIEGKGIPRDVVDAYIAGQEALATNTRTQMFSEVGGEATYSEMMEWAGNALSAQEVKSYNDTMGSGDSNQIQLAVKGLHAQYTASEGSNPKLMSGDTTANAGSSFDSVAQITAAMRDPKYRSDPAYRKEVEAKLARSNVI
mgnify:CR=1 FL=1